jgi:hypothetical protein
MLPLSLIVSLGGNTAQEYFTAIANREIALIRNGEIQASGYSSLSRKTPKQRDEHT